MRIIACSNSKGGVGKSFSSVHLAVGLARAGGYRVLLVDLDMQSNASRWLLPAHTHALPGLAEAMLRAAGPRPEELHPVESAPGLTVLPATARLAEVEAALPGRMSAETTLRRVLAPLAGAYDVAILDCPPTRNAFVLNALTAAEKVLVPLHSEKFSLDGLKDLEATVRLARELLNPHLEVLGLLHYAVSPRTVAARRVREQLQASHGHLLMSAEVRTSEAARQLPDRHLTAWDAGADERGAEDWSAVLPEVLERLAAPTQIAAARGGARG